jgi:hypothetical protein
MILYIKRLELIMMVQKNSDFALQYKEELFENITLMHP